VLHRGERETRPGEAGCFPLKREPGSANLILLVVPLRWDLGGKGKKNRVRREPGQTGTAWQRAAATRARYRELSRNGTKGCLSEATGLHTGPGGPGPVLLALVWVITEYE
jgi:hypothetical protein